MRKSARFAVWAFVLFVGFFGAGCGPNQEQRDVALMKAAYSGTVKDVQDALAAGGNPNAPHFGPGGMTPLMFAAAHNADPGVIDTLLKAGAKADARTAVGETALMFAVRYNRPLEIVNALLAAPLPKEAALAMLNAQDWRGDTALIRSVRHDANSLALAEILLRAGADGTIKNSNGSSAFGFASHIPMFINSPLFEAASQEVAQAKAKAKVEQLREAERKAKGEPEPERVMDPDEGAPEQVDETEEYAKSPGRLPEEVLNLPAEVVEYDSIHHIINLDRYNVDNPDALLPVLGEPSRFSLFAVSEMPVLDGALGSFPLYSAFARVCYTGLGKQQEDGKQKHRAHDTATYGPPAYDDTRSGQGTVTFYNTGGGFSRLITKEIDIFFGLTPDAEQKAQAAKYGRELVYTPLGREAFVFFTNKNNPVNNLTQAQLRDIYAGKITNWKEVGGLDQPILAFQRNQGSGSQSALERFMGDRPLTDKPEELVETMEGIVTKVADYRAAPNALGYSFYFFATRLAPSKDVKLLSVDGVAPSPDTIRDRSYPLLETRWAITLKDNKKPAVARFLEWMQGPQGQKIVKDMGYAGNGG